MKQKICSLFQLPINLYLTHWLAWRWLANYYSPLSNGRKTKWVFFYIVTNKVTLWSASYSACAVYTKTIIHLSVSESGEYLAPL